MNMMQLCMNEITIAKQGTLIDHIEACAANGITEMEIRKPFLLEHLRRGGSLEEVKAALDRCGVRPVCLNSIESISFNNKRGMRVLTEMSEYLFYCCRAIGCDCVEVIASFKVPTEDEQEIHTETVQALQQLSDAAKPYGVKLALEYMGVPASSVKTFNQALAIVNEVDRENVGILLDTWHHYAGGSGTDDILKADRGQIFIVHTSDCPRREPLEALRPESFMPGDGVVEIGAMLENLKKVGYDGPVSVEVMAPEIQAMPTQQLFKLAVQTTRPLLDALN
jgi:2-keto-myo-inositol isomerase